MASKYVFLLLACFLLLNTMGDALAPVGSPKTSLPTPYKNPPSAPIAKAPPPPSTVAKTPPPPTPVPKTPPTPVTKTPPPPVVKSPPPSVAKSPPPPVIKTPPPPVAKSPPTPPAVKPPRNRQECIPLCLVRCKLHSRKNICMRACLACCERCKCVPPGYYGNKEKCGTCYANMTTTGGRPKCP